MEWIKAEGKGGCRGLGRCFVIHGVISTWPLVVLSMGITLFTNPKAPNLRYFLLDDFSNSDLEVNKLASSSLATFRLLLKLKVPRILEVRGVIASS